MTKWIEPGSGPGESYYLGGSAVDKDGDIFVVDNSNSRIQKFTSDGKFLYDQPIHPSCDPYDIVIDTKGYLWVTQTGWTSETGDIARIEQFKITKAKKGSVTTPLIEFSDLYSYIGIVPTEKTPGSTTINYEYSIDGENRDEVPEDKILMGVSTDTKNMQFRTTLMKGTESKSPAIDKLKVEYVDWESGSSIDTVQTDRNSKATTMGEVTTEENFKAGENYVFPNPAKQKEPTFHFEFNDADKIQLRVYNIAAELIFEKEIKEPQGEHEYRWDTSRISPGVYIYTIRAFKEGENDITMTKKLALMK